jgi:hypothetical protein
MSGMKTIAEDLQALHAKAEAEGSALLGDIKALLAKVTGDAAQVEHDAEQGAAPLAEQAKSDAEQLAHDAETAAKPAAAEAEADAKQIGEQAAADAEDAAKNAGA